MGRNKRGGRRTLVDVGGVDVQPKLLHEVPAHQQPGASGGEVQRVEAVAIPHGRHLLAEAAIAVVQCLHHLCANGDRSPAPKSNQIKKKEHRDGEI